MRRIVKALRRPPTGRGGDRTGGFSRLSDIVAGRYYQRERKVIKAISGGTFRRMGTTLVPMPAVTNMLLVP
jgi:hypothetical protein